MPAEPAQSIAPAEKQKPEVVRQHDPITWQSVGPHVEPFPQIPRRAKQSRISVTTQLLSCRQHAKPVVFSTQYCCAQLEFTPRKRPGRPEHSADETITHEESCKQHAPALVPAAQPPLVHDEKFPRYCPLCALQSACEIRMHDPAEPTQHAPVVAHVATEHAIADRKYPARPRQSIAVVVTHEPSAKQHAAGGDAAGQYT